jgi:hypothetical protein
MRESLLKFRASPFPIVIAFVPSPFAELDRSHIRKWKDLALAFLKQYKHNIDMAPDRMDLQNMGKKGASSGNQQKGSQKQARTKPFHFPRTMSSGQSA